MPSYERFKLALDNIDGAQWRLFEQTANVFLAEEYPSLRPMAAASGDDGMDAQLFKPTDDDAVVIQFSVRKDWDAKIRQTCKRLKETSPGTSMLIYATNQRVGPRMNAVKKAMRADHKMFVDIRDQEWFLTQRNRNTAVESEAERFCEKIADPLLVGSKDTLQRQGQALEDLEAKAAFVYLGLQWADDNREKGLTKVCFEAIVRAVLRDTGSEERMTRSEVKSQVKNLLPAHDSTIRDAQVDGALKRLSKVHIRHWKKLDEFCLTWDERVRLSERLANMESLDQTLRDQLASVIRRVADEDGAELAESEIVFSVERARSVLERVLLDRGEAFAEAVIHDRGAGVAFEDIEALVYSDFATNNAGRKADPRLIASALVSLLADPPEEVKAYLRSLADTYTLFAFMRETPDVQSAVVKIFSEGDIWLDTSVVLPLFAEELLEEGSRAHSLMVRAAREAGLRLFVTEGVIQELASHIHRCRGYYHALARGEAYGPEPFLLSSFRLSGRDSAEFETWLQIFCGSSRPEDDVADYLSEVYGIETQNLIEFLDRADPEVAAMVGEVWHEARDARDERLAKLGQPPMDAGTRSLLVSHDVENYLGVQMRREARGERRSAFGYKSWWLTLDRAAFRMKNTLSERMDGRPMDSPAISPDFMLHYLAIGPVRARLSKRTEETLPLMLNMTVLDAVPRDLLDLSDTLRKELAGLPPHVVKRKIRDTLDDARLLLGSRAKAGEEGLTDEIKARLVAQAKAR